MTNANLTTPRPVPLGVAARAPAWWDRRSTKGDREYWTVVRETMLDEYGTTKGIEAPGMEKILLAALHLVPGVAYDPEAMAHLLGASD